MCAGGTGGQGRKVAALQAGALLVQNPLTCFPTPLARAASSLRRPTPLEEQDCDKGRTARRPLEVLLYCMDSEVAPITGAQAHRCGHPQGWWGGLLMGPALQQNIKFLTNNTEQAQLGRFAARAVVRHL